MVDIIMVVGHIKISTHTEYFKKRTLQILQDTPLLNLPETQKIIKD